MTWSRPIFVSSSTKEDALPEKLFYQITRQTEVPLLRAFQSSSFGSKD
jgi:hypothetical protein